MSEKVAFLTVAPKIGSNQSQEKLGVLLAAKKKRLIQMFSHFR